MWPRSNKKSDPNDPIEDLVDWEHHRYDPGFWPSEWWKKGRFDPEVLIWKRANLSSFWRTVLIYPIIAFVLIGPIMFLQKEISHAGIIVIAANIIIFLGTWLLIHKSMHKRKDKNSKREPKNCFVKKGTGRT